MGTIIKLYAGGTGGVENGVANLDVPMPGALVGVDWSVQFSLATDFYFEAQVSFRGAGDFVTNDDRGIISEIRARYEITTTGASQLSENRYVWLPDLPVMGGERIYLHLEATASVLSTVSAMLHFDFNLDKVSMRRR